MTDQTTTTDESAPEAGHGGNAQGEQSMRGLYITIFLTLAILTVFEVYIPSVYSAAWSGTTKMLLLCFLAFSKAALVATYFMHLKWEKPWLRWIALMPVYMGFAVVLLMLETLYR
jgi:caa(3)-type oxidase subunit IV